mgnify:CR=1 FL=1
MVSTPKRTISGRLNKSTHPSNTSQDAQGRMLTTLQKHQESLLDQHRLF